MSFWDKFLPRKVRDRDARERHTQEVIEESERARVDAEKAMIAAYRRVRLNGHAGERH